MTMGTNQILINATVFVQEVFLDGLVQEVLQQHLQHAFKIVEMVKRHPLNNVMMDLLLTGTDVLQHVQ